MSAWLDNGWTSRVGRVSRFAARPPFHAQIVGRGERIRTFDLLNPIQVRYQTALRPDRQSLAAAMAGSDLRTRESE